MSNGPPSLTRLIHEQVKRLLTAIDGDPQAVFKTRVFLRNWFTGRIGLEPLPDGGLVAHWNQNTTALFRGCERLVAGARYRSIKTLIALRQCGRELRFSSAHRTEFARNPSSKQRSVRRIQGVLRPGLIGGRPVATPKSCSKKRNHIVV
jgi:hypothetical protein